MTYMPDIKGFGTIIIGCNYIYKNSDDSDQFNSKHFNLIEICFYTI